MSVVRTSKFTNPSWWTTLLITIIVSPSICVHYSKEVCQNENFQAVCPSGHVIMMTSVFYGRMRIGRCVKTHFGYEGCYNDVIGHAHRRCSGRQSCSIRIPDTFMDRTDPCNDDLKSYLEANYTCIKITTRGHDVQTFSYSDSHCTLQLDESNPQIYLLHSQQKQQNHNNNQFSPCPSPWLINARSGQRISIELYDFSAIPSLLPTNTTPTKTSHNSASRRSSTGKYLQQPEKHSPRDLNNGYSVLTHQSNSIGEHAPLYRTLIGNQKQFSSSSEFPQQKPFSHCLISVANVHDLINVTATVETFESTPSYTLCGSDLNSMDNELKSIMKEKETKMKSLEIWIQAYESRGSSVKLEMLRSHLHDTVYLLKMEATGCPTMDTFSDDVTVTQYDVSTLKIECRKNGRVVYLLCNGTKWNGTINSCDSIDTAFSTRMESAGFFSFGTVTLVGLILIWTVAMAILFLGLYYFRRKRLQQMKQGSDIGLKDLKPLNSQDAMYDVTNQDIYAKNQAFETTTTTTKNQLIAPSSPESKHSPIKTNSSTLPPSAVPPSAVSVLLPSKKANSLLASKTRPAAVEFCTRVWQSPESSRRNKDVYPAAPVMTFHPTVSRRQNYPQIPAHQHQQLHQHLGHNDFPVHHEPQMSYSPHLRQPQMLGLRAVWIDNGDCSGGYQNSVINQTYSLPDKSRKIRTSNLVVLSQCNEYENEDEKDGYVQQRRLPLPPSSNAPLLTLAFRNATYNSWNSNSLPTQNGSSHCGNGSVASEFDGDLN